MKLPLDAVMKLLRQASAPVVCSPFVSFWVAFKSALACRSIHREHQGGHQGQSHDQILHKTTTYSHFPSSSPSEADQTILSTRNCSLPGARSVSQLGSFLQITTAKVLRRHFCQFLTPRALFVGAWDIFANITHFFLDVRKRHCVWLGIPKGRGFDLLLLLWAGGKSWTVPKSQIIICRSPAPAHPTYVPQCLPKESNSQVYVVAWSVKNRFESFDNGNAFQTTKKKHF